MDRAVPGHVQETDEVVAIAGTDPAKAPPLDLAPPVVVEHRMRERVGMQRVELRVAELPAPLVSNRHATEDIPMLPPDVGHG